MTNGPKFEELVDVETTGPERERLQRMHSLLVEAGPPPELTPRLEKAPEVDNVLALSRLPANRRAVLVLVAAAVAGAFFAAGYGIGNGRGSGGGGPVETLGLAGTSYAPHAQATLSVDREVSGNWPMMLTVSGLPKLSAPSYYVVYLVRDGHPLAPCGTFVVDNPSSTLTLSLNAPYMLEHGDTWIVTRQTWPKTTPGPTVLRPVTT